MNSESLSSEDADALNEMDAAISESLSDISSAPSFWYRIDDGITPDLMTRFTDRVAEGLTDLESCQGLTGLVDEFHSLQLVADLRAGDKRGQSVYTESPMAVFVLFGLHRAYPLSIHISDDNNDLLRDRMSDLRSLLSDEALFGPLPAYWHPPVFKQVAAAMQCIDLASDLSRIKTETPAAFF